MRKFVKFNLLVLFTLFAVQLAYGQTFHAILVANTEVEDIGKSCEKDLITMTIELNSIAAAIGFEMKQITISRNGFNFENLENALNGFSCSPDDVVFFYYSGHGYNTNNGQSRWPIMHMNTGGFPLDKVHEKLIAKGSRLVLSMGDCCNNIFNPFAGNEKGFFVVESDSALTKEQFYKSLFAESRGDIIFSGSEVGQCSYGTNLPSWESIMEDAKNRVSKLNFEQKQIPQFAINLKSTPVPDNPLIPVDPDEPQIKYDHINKYLNDLTDESLTTQSRDKLANDFGKYFIPKTRVDLYVNTTLTEVMTIEDYVKRIKLHGKKISYINLIENKSTKDGNSKKFNHITVQEIWNK